MPELVLQPVVDKIDTVPETHRELYEERDGKFVLSKPVKIDDPRELKSALQQEREMRRQLTEKVGDLPDDWKERIKRADEYEQQELERKGQYQELLKTTEDRYKGEIGKREERITLLTGTLERTMVVNAATNALNALSAPVKALLPHVLPHLQAVENAERPGEFEVFVKDPKDPKKMRVDLKTNEPFTVDQLIEELRADDQLSKLFPASAATGSGGAGSGFVRGGNNRIVKLTEEEAKDPQRYKQLRAQKEKGEIDGAVDHLNRRLV
jgi:hypothetical protein